MGFAAALAGVSLAGCATPPTDSVARAAYDQANDPLEPLNRKTFALNQFLDKAFFKPAAKTYVAVFPEDARKAIHHMLDNMKEPTLFFNNILQGQFKRAAITFGRFAVNTTVGFAGMVDVMTMSGVERQPADFGQTLYVWGVPSGPYLILPILGPTNPRDAVGSAVDSYDDPFTIVANEHGVTELTTARFIVGGVEERADVLDELDAIEKNAVDFYAEMRSLAQQHRAAELKNGKAPDAEPDLYMDPGKTTPTSAPSASPPPAPATPAAPAAKPSAEKAQPVKSVASASRSPLHRYAVHTAALKRWPQHGANVIRCSAPRCVAPKA
ncbi:MAG TPA: VacJ family lipoprotein [Stellaceae bacterium]|jgi:phospholipid-binding lipoprotein MlaA|nr:VacJ family lipoprotein [Stellaceae bacterium]